MGRGDGCKKRLTNNVPELLEQISRLRAEYREESRWQRRKTLRGLIERREFKIMQLRVLNRR